MTNKEIVDNAVDELDKDKRHSSASWLQEYQDVTLPLLQQAREEGRKEGVLEALSHNIPGAPMTEEEIVRAYECFISEKDKVDRPCQNKDENWWPARTEYHCIHLFYLQIRWLEQCLRDAGQDTWGDGYRAGFKAGREKVERAEEPFDLLVSQDRT